MAGVIDIGHAVAAAAVTLAAAADIIAAAAAQDRYGGLHKLDRVSGRLQRLVNVGNIHYTRNILSETSMSKTYEALQNPVGCLGARRSRQANSEKTR